MNEKRTLENQAREELIEVQSRIAGLSAEIESHQSEIREVLNNRALHEGEDPEI